MKKLLLLSALFILACSSNDSSNDNSVDPVDDTNPIYLAENGVTIKAREWAEVGDIGTVNGEEYIVVDEILLLDWYFQDWEVDFFDNFFTNNNIKPCISKITSFNQIDNTNLLLNNVFYYGTEDLSTGEFIEYDLPPDFEQVIMSFDVSNVTTFTNCFQVNKVFNIDISYWDVSSAVDMKGMFFQAHSFNQDISNWDVSNVESMQGMFAYAGSFNQPIGDWDVSSAVDMTSMFGSSDVGNEDVNPPTIFNQDISNWDVSSVTSMTGMFDGNIEFNQDISNWDVSSVTSMWRMFKNASSFNQALGNWSVGNVTSCSSFSQGASAWTLPKPNFTNCNPN
jgi:surface protein